MTYRDDLLTVVSHNSSLNQILREVARQTGTKIVGGVQEDRVFGTYGPASPSAVLATLLDGTGTNLLIVQNASHTPTEIVLTPRTGGITPPNPAATDADENDTTDAEPQRAQAPPRQAAPEANNSNNPRATSHPGNGGADANPAATSPSSSSQQLLFPPLNATTPSSTATTTPVSSDPTADTVKTPQQIFEQLQRLRQQQTPSSAPQ